MQIHHRWNRRGFLGALASLTAAGAAPAKLFASSTPASPQVSPTALTGLGQTGNVYQELGVTTVINGEGTMTTLGGSLIRSEVEQVMQLAAQHFVSIPELEIAAGKRVSEMLKLPQGYT